MMKMNFILNNEIIISELLNKSLFDNQKDPDYFKRYRQNTKINKIDFRKGANRYKNYNKMWNT